MKKTYLLISLIFACALHSKNKHEFNDSNYLQTLYEKMFREFSKVSKDTTLLRAEKILSFLEENNKSPNDKQSILEKIQNSTILLLMNLYDT